MRRLIALAIVLGVIVLLLIVAQLVLPGIAAHRLRDRLSKSGQVIDIQVSAFPAIELLWHQADRVVVRLKSYRSNPGRSTHRPASSTLDWSRSVTPRFASAALR